MPLQINNHFLGLLSHYFETSLSADWFHLNAEENIVGELTGLTLLYAYFFNDCITTIELGSKNGENVYKTSVFRQFPLLVQLTIVWRSRSRRLR